MTNRNKLHITQLISTALSTVLPHQQFQETSSTLCLLELMVIMLQGYSSHSTTILSGAYNYQVHVSVNAAVTIIRLHTIDQRSFIYSARTLHCHRQTG